MRCKACRTPKTKLLPRGLCRTCYNKPEIRSKFPCLIYKEGRYRKARNQERGEPTQAQLDQILAEQMAKPKPKWWKEYSTIFDPLIEDKDERDS